jgi:hypothetical protein
MKWQAITRVQIAADDQKTTPDQMGVEAYKW